jgi:hypothetical protein
VISKRPGGDRIDAAHGRSTEALGRKFGPKSLILIAAAVPVSDCCRCLLNLTADAAAATVVVAVVGRGLGRGLLVPIAACRGVAPSEAGPLSLIFCIEIKKTARAEARAVD